MCKVSAFLRSHSKMFMVSAMCALMIVVGSVNCFAADESLVSTFTSSLETMKSDILTYLGVALGAGLAVVGAYVAVKKGISFIKGVIGR